MSDYATSTITSALIAQKKSRKKAAEDVKILENRIALLRAEEHKAIKNIKETKEKAHDILISRKRNYQGKIEKY